MRKLNSVMLIEDDEIDGFLHKAVLEKSGVVGKIEIAETVKDAIAQLEKIDAEKSSYPELIFLDLNMPGQNGWSFVEEVNKKKPPGMNSIVIVLSATVNPDDREKAHSFKGISGFRSKPLTRRMLQEIMEEFFNEKNLS